MKKKKILFLAQALVSLLILSYIALSFPLADIGRNLLKQNLLWSLAALVLSLGFIQIAAALRWQNILRLAGINENLAELIKINYTSLFLGLMLPSSDGYAAIRLLLLEKKYPLKRGVPSGTVIVEKLLGMLVLGVLGVLFSFWLPAEPIVSAARVCFLMLIVTALTLMTIISSSLVHNKVEKFLQKRGWKRANDFLGRMHAGISKISFTKIIIKVLPFIVLVQILVILVPFLIFKSMGIEIPVIAHFALIPISQIITLLPVSFNGLGLREGSFVILYRMFGIEPALAVSASIQYFTLLILLPALVGSVVMWSNSLLLDKKEIINEQ